MRKPIVFMIDSIISQEDGAVIVDLSLSSLGDGAAENTP